MIAKNKEDTVILASSSPTIIQKESTDALSASSSINVGSPGIGVGVVGTPTSPGGPISSLVLGAHPATPTGVLQPAAGISQPLTAADAELQLAEQAILLDSSRSNPLALAAAAVLEPAAGQARQPRPLATVSTQLLGSGFDLQQQQQQQGQPASTSSNAAHQLSSSGTIKQAGPMAPTGSSANSTNQSPRKTNSSSSTSTASPTTGEFPWWKIIQFNLSDQIRPDRIRPRDSAVRAAYRPETGP